MNQYQSRVRRAVSSHVSAAPSRSGLKPGIALSRPARALHSFEQIALTDPAVQRSAYQRSAYSYALGRVVESEEDNTSVDLMRPSDKATVEILSQRDGLGIQRDDTTQTSSFPSMSVMAGDSVVEAHRSVDWNAGMSDFNERAGWILWDADANTFAVTGKVTGDEDGVNPTPTKPTDDPANNVFLTGHYHQHPPIRPGRPGTFPVGPSTADSAFANANNCPGIVRDFTDTTRSAVTDYKYGPDQRVP